MKKNLLLAIVLLSVCRTFLAAAIRIGTEVETGGTSYSNADYSNSSSLSNSYNYQMSRLYLEGDLKNNVTVGVKLLSRGIFGKDFGAQLTSTRSAVSFINYTPQIENAFIKFSSVNSWPVDFIAGRQPIMIGQGVIVDDDGLGFDALRAKGYLPHDIDLDAFLIRRSETGYTQATNEKGQGLSAIGANWTYQDDYNFRLYYFVETSSFTPVYGVANSTYTLPALSKNFISLRADGKFAQGVDYRAEVIKAGGDYSGISYLVGATAHTYVNKLGKTSVNFEYAVGTGKKNGLGFDPTYGHKIDGLERSGYGEYFGASMSDFYGGLTNYKPTGQGVHTTTLGVGIEPYKNLQINFDYFIAFSLDFPSLTDSNLGDETDVTLKYQYTDNCFFRLIYGRFSPSGSSGLLTLNTTKLYANKLGWSVSAKF